MTEQQARAFMAQVASETPEVLTRIGRGRQAKQYAGRILSAYKPEDWLPIKWAWELEDAPEEKPDHYLIDNIAMTVNCYKGYWYGRWQVDGKSKRKFLGKVDPRTQYPLVEKKEEVTI